MLIQVANLAIVLFVLKKTLFDPYLKMVEKTEADQAEIANVHAMVEKIKKDAEKEATALVSDAHKKAFEMREHAAKNAQKNADDIIAQAEEQARIIRERAE
jgi:F0F1-type ATP synthase membrane subunit b/b'